MKRKLSPLLTRTRRPLALLFALALLLSLAACGGSSGGSASYNSYDTDSFKESAYEVYDEAEAGEYYYGDAAMPMEAPAAMRNAASDGSIAGASAQSSAATPRKLIRTANIEMETTTFDESAAALTELVDSLGGYFSDASTGDRGGSRRHANYSIRVPADRFNEFLSQVGDICHETWRDVTQDDISERYYDTQGRLRTQNTKLSRLQELLTQAEDMEDIITIQSAISETEERIEELQGTLSHWDNLVDYATINLSLSEVYRLSNNPPVPETFATRLGSAFTSGIADFAEWVGDLIISLAYSWLWWLLLVLVVLGVLRVRRTAWWQKKRAEKEARREARQQSRQAFPYRNWHAGKNGTSSTEQTSGQDAAPSDKEEP